MSESVMTVVALGAAAAWPLATREQQLERVRKVGVLVPAAVGMPLHQAIWLRSDAP